MDSDFRKVALIAAVLGLLVSLFFALRPDDEENAAGTTAQTTTVQTTTEAPPAPAVVRARIVVPADAAPTVERFSVQRGRQVVLVVESGLTDHVHLHGYDLTTDVAPGAPATVRFTADAPGLFEIELEDRGLQIGELEVRP